MNSVAPSRRPRACAWRVISGDSRTGREVPLALRTVGRGRSVGISRRGGSPAS